MARTRRSITGSSGAPKNGVFERIFEELAMPQNDAGNVLMIDATHLKAHRTASSLKKGETSQA